MPRKRGHKKDGTVFFDQSKQKWIGETSIIINGKRRFRKVSALSKTDAKTRLRQLLLEIAEKRQTILVDKERISSYLATWVDSLELAPSTILRYRSLLSHVFKHELVNLRMAELESCHILAFYGDLKKMHSESTVKKIHTMLHGAFEAARHTRHGFFRNPCDLPKNQRPKYKPKEQGFPFDRDKEAIFLHAVEGDPLEALYILALDSGMRQAELFALEWRDVDWKNRSVEVRQTLKDTANGLIIGETKNKQRRAIKVSSTTLQALEKHRKTQSQKLGFQDLVFPDRMGGYMRRQNFNRRDFAKALERAGKESGLDFSLHSFHDLRHTCATLLLADGEAVTRVSQRLGHATVKTTLEVYAHAIPQDEDRPAARFEQRRALR